MVNGSAVTGGWDDHSDLDVEAWCSGDAATTYDAVLALVRERASTSTTCGSCRRRPGRPGGSASSTSSPTRPTSVRPTRLLDLVVQTDAGAADDGHPPPRHADGPARPGRPAAASRTTTRPSWRRSAGRRSRRRRRGARRRPGWWSGPIARGDLAEATLLHLRFAVEPLVRLLRIQHCPARHDFGLRYLAHRPARRDGGAGGSTAARAGPGGPDPGSVRVAGRGPGSARVRRSLRVT